MNLLERFKNLTTGTTRRTLISSITIALLIPVTLLASTRRWELRKGAAALGNAEAIITFPEDEGNHPEFGVEWWYLNFHLTGQTTRKRYAGTVAFFRSDYLSDFRLIEITDESGERFFYHTASGALQAERNRLDVKFPRGDGSFDSWQQDLVNLSKYQIEALDLEENLGLTLSLSSTKNPLLEDEDGYVQISPDTYSYYYSQTGIDVVGDLRVNGRAEMVSGRGWVDHQWFQPGFVRPTHEWFSVRLDNGADLVFWHLFYQGERILPKITILYPDGHQESPQDFDLLPVAYWRAPSGKLYASRWWFREPGSGANLLIQTTVDDQLVQGRVRGEVAEVYEGSTSVAGTMEGLAVSGKGFAELSHAYTEIPGCAPESLLPGDLDCDCDVDIADVMKVCAVWNTREGEERFNPDYDFDNDGRISVADIMHVAAKWNTRCGE